MPVSSSTAIPLREGVARTGRPNRAGDVAFACGLASLGLVVFWAFVPTLFYQPGDEAAFVLLLGLAALVPVFALSVAAVVTGVTGLQHARVAGATNRRRARAGLLLSLPGLVATSLGVRAFVLVALLVATG